jgi:hypothetical protein
MIHNLLICLFTLLFSLNLVSCGGDSGGNETPEIPASVVTPGTLYLAKAEGMESDGKAVDQLDTESENAFLQREEMDNEDETISFHLGDIKASRDFYFILKNVGDTPITDISLETDNPSFEVSPASISFLEPDDEASVMQIICVSAIHGQALNGIGYAGRRNIGENSCVLRIQGKTTTGEGEEQDVVHTAGIGVNAILVDLEIRSETKQVSFGSPDTHMSSSLGGLGWLPVYGISGTPVIENTGNAPFDVIFRGNVITVLPNETLTIENDGSDMTMTIDTKNAMCDPGRFSIGDDGKIYFCLRMS